VSSRPGPIARRTAIRCIAAGRERKLEIEAKGELTQDGVSLDAADAKVTLTFDRAFSGSINGRLNGRFGVGRQTTVELDLASLATLGTEALEALLAGSAERAAEVLAELPIKLSGQARLERGFERELGVELGQEFATAKLSAELLWTDAGEQTSSVGLPCGGALAQLVEKSLDLAIPEETLSVLDQLGEQVVDLRSDL